MLINVGETAETNVAETSQEKHLTVCTPKTRSCGGKGAHGLDDVELEKWWRKHKNHRWHPAKGLYYRSEDVGSPQGPNITGHQMWRSGFTDGQTHHYYADSGAGRRKSWDKWKIEFHGVE